MRVYNLRKTSHRHHLRRRPYYHDLRAGIHEALKLKIAEPQDFIDHGAGTPPIEDQGQEGACQSFQLRNVLLSAQWLASGVAPSFDLSKAFAYFVARSLDDMDSEDSGESIGNTLAGAEAKGCCEESYMPYKPGDFTTKPSEEAYANALTHRYDLKAVPVDYSNWGNVCDVLQDRRPIIGGFSVPASFESCPNDGKLPDPGNEEELGLHAFSMDQASRRDGWWRNPNSWGTGWGAGGFCYMGGGYLRRVVELWTFVPGNLIQGT